MKTVVGKTIIIFLLGVLDVIAGPVPPPPPPPPGLSVDENIFILLIMALLFGIYIIYKNLLKSKNPT